MILTGCTSNSEKNSDFKIVTSFYPIYTIAKNIAGNVDGVSISNMAGHSARMLAWLYINYSRPKKNRDSKYVYF